MTTFDPTQLNALVADVEAKEGALQTASDANDQAQAAAQSAVAAASATLAAKNSAHDDLTTSVNALVAYAQGLTT